MASADTLSYVPVANPRKASSSMTTFLATSHTPSVPFVQATISSISGGNMRASEEEQKAPMSEMKAPRFGTHSAIRTVRKEKRERESKKHRVS